MKKIYKPQKSFLKSIWISFGVLLLFYLLVGVTSGTATIGSVIEGMSLAICFFLFFPIMFTFYTYIQIDKDRLKFVKWLVMRGELAVSRIQSIKCQKTFMGLATDVDIYFLTESNTLSHNTVGTLEGYGNDAVREIVNQLLKVNPSITLDARSETI